MDIYLYILVDKYGRVLYTGYTEQLVETYKLDNNLFETEVIVMKGEMK